MKKANWVGFVLLSVATAAGPAGAKSFTLDGCNLQAFTVLNTGTYEFTGYGTSGGKTNTPAAELDAETGGALNLAAANLGNGGAVARQISSASEVSTFPLAGLPIFAYALIWRKRGGRAK